MSSFTLNLCKELEFQPKHYISNINFQNNDIFLYSSKIKAKPSFFPLKIPVITRDQF